jgi:hypothetical protein
MAITKLCKNSNTDSKIKWRQTHGHDSRILLFLNIFLGIMLKKLQVWKSDFVKHNSAEAFLGEPVHIASPCLLLSP